MRSPLFIVGAPRSGTTYLVEVLNQHDQVMITNEARVFTFLSRSLHRLAAEDFVLGVERERFLSAYESHLAQIVEGFYRDLGVEDGVLWGDKFPHYADGGRDPECLDLINRTFPRCRFIHLIRDGRDVVASLAAKRWVGLVQATDVWKRHVRHARNFGTSIGLDRYLEVRYEDLVADGEVVLKTIETFLDLPHSEAVRSFVSAQRQERTPFSHPTSSTSELGATGMWRGRLTESQQARVLDLIRHTLEEFGYLDVRDGQLVRPA